MDDSETKTDTISVRPFEESDSVTAYGSVPSTDTNREREVRENEVTAETPPLVANDYFRQRSADIRLKES
jgi:hypothetical protein